jgi:mRNA interferase MazF
LTVGMKNQVHGIMYKQREIVLVPFPFTDLSGIKKRPVLIVSNDGFNEKSRDILVCVITSKEHYDDFSIPIGDENLEYGFLPESSVIKTQNLFTLQQTKIIKKYSSINRETFAKVIENIIKLL